MYIYLKISSSNVFICLFNIPLTQNTLQFQGRFIPYLLCNLKEYLLLCFRTIFNKKYPTT